MIYLIIILIFILIVKNIITMSIFNKSPINLKKSPTNKHIFQNENSNIKNKLHKKTKSSTFSKTKNSISLLSSDLVTNKRIQKLQDELSEYKIKSDQFQKEIKSLNDKIKKANSFFFRPKKPKLQITKPTSHPTFHNPNGKEGEIVTNIINPKILKIIQSSYDVFLDIIELFLSQKPNKDQSFKRNSVNTSCSIDIYEPSILNEEDKRTALIEQIQNILIFKLNFLSSNFKFGLENQVERVKNWQTTKEKENISNLSLYSNISFRNKANNNQSPKFFRKDSIDSNKYYSSYKDDNYSNIIDESTIKEFNQSIIRTNTEKHNDDFLSLDGDNDYSRTKEKEDNNENKYSFVNASFKAQSIKEGDTVNEEKSKENGKEYFGDKEFSLSLNYNNNPIFINEQNELSFNDVDNKN